MNSRQRWFAWIAAMVGMGALNACNVTIPKTAIDAKTLAMVRKIAVVAVKEPERYHVVTGTHPGMLFGAVGGAIAGAHMEARADAFTAKLGASSSFSLSESATDSVVRALERAGFEARRLPVAMRGPKNDEFGLDYSKIQTDADAILNVTVKSAGFAADFGTYAATAYGTVELVSANGQKRRLYFDRFEVIHNPPTSNAPFPEIEPIYVKYTGRNRFATFEQLLERSHEAGAELEAAVGAAMDTVVKQMCASSCAQN